MNIIMFLRSFTVLLLSCVTIITRFDWCFSSITSSSSSFPLNAAVSSLGGGHLSFDETSLRNAAKDFGNRFHYQPMAVMNPESVSDIANTIKHVWLMGPTSHLTVAARGHGHSLQGQAQAPNGIVINMESLKLPGMQVHLGGDSHSDSDSDSDSDPPYVDVSGGELWINILHETLRFGLTPRSWTDYLHLTVGGTLSNAGVSGQAFRHGPQISNVQQLEIVTGTGQVVNCSKDENGELFHSVLGGLGQFGIITRARISLEPAPTMVKWIRVLYSDFTAFTRDQEKLISSENNNAFDYIEGFVIINRTGLLNNWRSTFNPQDPIQASHFKSDGRTLFCLELAKYFNPQDIDFVNEEVEKHLSYLHYIESTLFLTEVTYVEFLDRVHVSELKLRSKGLWDVPHPWLNLFVPRSNIHKFAEVVFGDILTETSNGPVLIYPVNKSKWDNRSSVVTPDEEVFYLVGILASVVGGSSGNDGIEEIEGENRRILEYCERSNLGVKQYLPHYKTQEEWKAHFGPKWESFLQRKSVYDPLAILAPGQRIFQKAINFS